MKALFVAITMLLTQVALAEIKIGSFTSFENTKNGSCGGENGISKTRTTLTSIEPDADGQTIAILKEETESVSGAKSEVQVMMSLESLIDGEQLKTTEGLASFCGQQSGAVVENVTVKAGTFSTCRINYHWSNDTSTQDGSMWIGGVAFGIVKTSAKTVVTGDRACNSEESNELTQFNF